MERVNGSATNCLVAGVIFGAFDVGMVGAEGAVEPGNFGPGSWAKAKGGSAVTKNDVVTQTQSANVER